MTGAAIQKLSMIFENRPGSGHCNKEDLRRGFTVGPGAHGVLAQKNTHKERSEKVGVPSMHSPQAGLNCNVVGRAGTTSKQKSILFFPPDTLLQICACAHHSCLHIQSGWCRCRRLRCLEDQQTSQDRGNSRDRIRSAQQMQIQKQTAPSNQKQPVQFIHQYPSTVVCKSIDPRIACT